MAGTTTYQLEGKSYTVPQGTSLDELNDFVRGQDPLISGKGMQENAQQQASVAPGSGHGPLENATTMPQTVGQAKLRERVGGSKLEDTANKTLPILEGTAAAAGAAMPFIDAGGLIPGAIKLATSTGGGMIGSSIGKRYGGPIGEVAGGIIGAGGGYKSPEIAEGIANRFMGEQNVPMWLKSPQSVGRMVSGARDEMYNDIGERAMSRPDLPEQGPEISIKKSPYFDAAEYKAGRKGQLPSSVSPEGVEGSVPRFKGPLVQSEQAFKAQDQMQDIAAQRAKERGMIFAGGGTPAGGRKIPRISTPTEEFEYPGPKFKKVIP